MVKWIPYSKFKKMSSSAQQIQIKKYNNQNHVRSTTSTISHARAGSKENPIGRYNGKPARYDSFDETWYYD